MSDGSDTKKTRSLWASEKAAEAAKALARFVDGTGSEESLALDLLTVSEAIGTPRTGDLTGADGAPLPREAPTSPEPSSTAPTAGAAPRRRSFDDPLPATDPMTGRPASEATAIPAGAFGPGEEGGEHDAKDAWKAYPPILEKVGERAEREAVLRYLTIHGPPEKRLSVAPFSSTHWFDDTLHNAHVTELERSQLLLMPQRTAQAFYTNLTTGGDGLRRFTP